MIGLDTNVLVRYLAQDDARQSPKATRLIESLSPEKPGFLSVVTLVELGWVLEACYDSGRDTIASTLEQLLQTRELVVERAETVWQAVRLFRSTRADFADCMIERTCAEAGCDATVTFDRAAARACGMRLLD
jgi:predicted nucleic-acid-binding protein